MVYRQNFIHKFLTNMSIFTAAEMVFITIYLNKKSMNVSLWWYFIKLNNDWCHMQTHARATEHRNKSIYLSMYFSGGKPVWKRVYIYGCIYLPSFSSKRGHVKRKHVLFGYQMWHVWPPNILSLTAVKLGFLRAWSGFNAKICINIRKGQHVIF